MDASSSFEKYVITCKRRVVLTVGFQNSPFLASFPPLNYNTRYLYMCISPSAVELLDPEIVW